MGLGNEEYDRLKVRNILVLGVILHVLLLLSIFDIYFVSPIEHGMTPHKSSEEAPAKRLVLIVADGLRAEALFGDGKWQRAPYLFSVLSERGSWGVSHTQVPTESRPGHVAMLAGIYEDPSAIMKGWKSNPVDFDSLINQSRNAWCWGSPDIVDMFNKDNLSYIHIESYDNELEDFSGKESTIILDDWVFKKVDKFVRNQGPKTNCKEFCDEQNLFFLHLLGLDTAGHSFKPHSEQYSNNIKFVDDGVKDIESVFEEFFDDNGTAYVFTSDHGMTDWGSHGAGSQHETEAPFIAWGAGINTNSTRKDVKQADIAPLLASLIGVNIPVNSVGIIPHSYLNVSPKSLANIVYTNAKQLAEQFKIKMSKKRETTLSWLHRPFSKLTDEQLNHALERIDGSIISHRYEFATRQSLQLMNLTLEGLTYYHNYYQNFLLTFVSLGLLGWMCFLCMSVTNFKETDLKLTNFPVAVAMPEKMRTDAVVLVVLYAFVALCLYVQSLPLSYYAYCALPFVTWWAAASEARRLAYNCKFVRKFGIVRAILHLLVYFCGIELLICAFFERKSLTVVSVFVGLSVIFEQKLAKFDKARWAASIAFLAVFPMLPVMKTSFSFVIFSASLFAWALILFWILTRPNFYISKKYWQALIVNLSVPQMLVFIISSANVLYVAVKFENLEGLPIFNQMISWTILGVSFILPTVSSKYVLLRLISIMLSLMSPYVLMSANHEVLFMASFVLVLYNWIILEDKLCVLPPQLHIDKTTFDQVSYLSRSSSKEDFRRGFFFIYFVFMAFFGTGNIASINSFDPMWVRCFVTVFSPFTMSSLILVKLFIPVLFVACVFRALNLLNRGKTVVMFSIVLLLCDTMVLHFIFLVKNKGSWLEIGTSISHFVIMEFTTICLLFLYGIAHLLTSVGCTCVKDKLAAEA